ncbi:conserved hypothetical protein [Trichinella spiralis]|uniref:hypothetical protein n=1 Tax=Trichinella spiralis TaxID=6334 RepID=UPI0001EFE0E5|nr:conserved hypothetical protein [Trichinella spiralis]
MLAVVTLLANKCRGLFCFADSAGRCFSGEFRQSFTSTSVECCLPSAAFIRACLVLLGMSRYCKKTARRVSGSEQKLFPLVVVDPYGWPFSIVSSVCVSKRMVTSAGCHFSAFQRHTAVRPNGELTI